MSAEARRSGCTFRVREQCGGWRVWRDGSLYGEFLTRGEAVRAACFAARAEEANGSPARVLGPPGNRRIPHYDPHFAE